MHAPATLAPPAAAATPCPHDPPCPAADAPDAQAAHVTAAHPEQGWSLLCNGVVVFDDLGTLPTPTTARTETGRTAR